MKYLTIIFATFLACSSNPRLSSGIEEFERNTTFKNIKWGTNDINRLNGNLKSWEIIFPTSIEAFGYCGAFFFLEPNQKDFGSLYNEFQKQAIYQKYLNDSCNLYITDRLINTYMVCSGFIPPVPDIYDDNSPLFGSKYVFSQNSQFIVLKYDIGNFVNPEFILSENNKLNKRIKNNGYSLGVLVDEPNHLIVYWIMIW